MKILTLLTYLSAVSGILLYFHPRNRLAALLMWPTKLTIATMTPITFLIALLGTLAGLLRRDAKLVVAGIIGSILAAQYFRTIDDNQPDYTGAFGPNWQDRIYQEQEIRFRQSRLKPDRSQAPQVIHQPDIIIGRHPQTDQAILADIWQPLVGEYRSGLAVIYTHGGAWRLGDKDEWTRPFFRRLVGLGHVVVDVGYLISPTTPIHEMVCDVKQALIWLKRYAGAYQIDPDRIVLAGGSAGAHLALLAAYTPNLETFQPPGSEEDTSVRGVVAFYPPVDLAGTFKTSLDSYQITDKMEGHGPMDELLVAALHIIGIGPKRDAQGNVRHFMTDLLGGAPEEIPETYRLLSPSEHVGPHCPPTLLLQGSDDFFELAPPVRRLQDSLQRAGVPSVLVEYPHTDHAFDLILPQISPVAQAAFYDVERFLAMLV